MTPRLIVIPISYYCERARWALQHCGIDFVEDHHLQLFHRRATERSGGTSTPVLVLPDRVLTDSHDIVSWADANSRNGRRLYPDDPDERAAIEAFERRVAHRFAIEGRRIMYWYFFRWGRPALPFNDGAAPRFQRWTVRAIFPVLRRLLTRALNVTDATKERARERVAEELAWLEETIVPGAEYVFGDRFTAADLTLAALSAPLVLPEQYGGPMPVDAELPDEVLAHKRYYRSTRVGQLALNAYERHRQLPR